MSLTAHFALDTLGIAEVHLGFIINKNLVGSIQGSSGSELHAFP